jgi:hypothetical protein
MASKRGETLMGDGTRLVADISQAITEFLLGTGTLLDAGAICEPHRQIPSFRGIVPVEGRE